MDIEETVAVPFVADRNDNDNDNDNNNKNPKTCTVIGGRGILGRSLVSRLLQLGNWIVRVADSPSSLLLHSSDESLLHHALSSRRASLHPLDLRDPSLILNAIEGSSVVFFMDATNLQEHDFYLSYMILVQGAKNVISACRQCNVRQLIYNSTADVIFDGSRDICNGDESLSCHWKFDDMLTDLKAQAEALILFANNIDGLLTCALRPTNVFGPGDTLLIPFLVYLAKSGWGKFIIGNGDNMSDFTYTENVIHAHICAAEALDSRMVSVAGKAFFITNLEPVKFWDFVSFIQEGLGFQRPLIKVPASLVWYSLLAAKWIHEKLGSKKFSYSFSAHFFHLASRTRTFNCAAAQRQIGYSPIVSLEDGIKSTIELFSHLAKDSSSMRDVESDEQSKADKILGGGKVADILLWRDEKKTFALFLAFAILFHWFMLSGRTFTSSAAKLILLIMTLLYGYANLPPKISNFTVHKIPPSLLEISEAGVKDTVKCVGYLWNEVVSNVRYLAQGEDWSNFCKVAVSLYFLKWIVLHSLTTIVGVALVFAFMAFFIYEQYESEIDGLAEILVNRLEDLKRLLMMHLPAPISQFFQEDRMIHQEKDK